MKLSIAIMAHPRRRAAAEALAEALPGAAVVFDPEPDGPPSALRTAVRAWSAVPADTTHHLVIQDDAVIGPCLPECTRYLVGRHPDSAIALFAQWNTRNGAATRLGVLSGASSVPLISGEYVPAVALVLPRAVALGFAHHARTRLRGQVEDDTAITAYLLDHGVQARVSTPSLVDHVDGESLVGNNDHGLRRAACFVGSAHPWARPDPPALEPAVVPYFRFGQSRAMVRLTTGPRAEWRKSWLREVPLGFALPSESDLDAALTGLGPLPQAIEVGVYRELWTSAYALGRMCSGTGHPTPEAAAAALSTMGIGGASKRISHAQLTATQQVLTSVATSGYQAGRGEVGR